MHRCNINGRIGMAGMICITSKRIGMAGMICIKAICEKL